MALNYRRLTEADLEVFIEMRIHQLREEGATEEMDLKSALRDYYHRHMADGTVCPLWRSRRILAAPVEKWDCFLVCSH